VTPTISGGVAGAANLPQTETTTETIKDKTKKKKKGKLKGEEVTTEDNSTVAEASQETEAVKTGDASPIYQYMLLFALATSSIVLFAYKKKKAR